MSKINRSFIFYSGLILVLIGAFLILRNIYILAIRQKLLLDLGGPLGLVIGGILLFIDAKRRKKLFEDKDDYRNASEQSSLAKTSIIIGVTIILLIILGFAAFILFFMLVPMGP